MPVEGSEFNLAPVSTLAIRTAAAMNDFYKVSSFDPVYEYFTVGRDNAQIYSTCMVKINDVFDQLYAVITFQCDIGRTFNEPVPLTSITYIDKESSTTQTMDIRKAISDSIYDLFQKTFARLFDDHCSIGTSFSWIGIDCALSHRSEGRIVLSHEAKDRRLYTFYELSGDTVTVIKSSSVCQQLKDEFIRKAAMFL